MGINNSFKHYLQESGTAINTVMHDFLNEYGLVVDKTSKELPELYTHFLESNFGGKVLRGSLVILGYTLAGGKNSIAILKPAAAFEILHTAFLILDDIIDESTLRRGSPSLYKVLGNHHYGISQALCLEHLGVFLASRLILESDFPESEKNRVLSNFFHVAADTLLGEMLDVKLANNKNIATEKDIYSVYLLKTARYTIVGPLVTGALLAGVQGKLLDDLRLFGEDVGYIFQIQDDILGMFGDVKTLGKSVTSDVEEGKQTILFTYCMTHANTVQKETFLQYYGKKDISESEYKQVQQILRDTGALDYANDRLRYHSDRAHEIIPVLTSDSIVRELLSSLVGLLVNRTK